MSIIDEGKFYRFFIDPMLKHQHEKVASQILSGSKVIDIACGTGALSLLMAAKAKTVTGIDLSESMINYAKQLHKDHGFANSTFILQDATKLQQFHDNEFDVATISMAIHQFPREIAKQILLEMNRIATSIIILDYADKMPKTLLGNFVKFIEWLAGAEHHTNFRTFKQYGGLATIVEECNLELKNRITSGRQLFSIITI